MKKLLICFLLISTGCATKVAAPGETWPEAPSALLAPVPNLTPLPSDDKSFSDLLLNINENYTAYYVLKNKFELWQQWYNEQKRIYKQSEQ
jgi:hypothetical protein